MHMRWPLWFSNDFQDIEQLAPISDQLKDEAFALNKLFADLTTWHANADSYLWNSNLAAKEFNRASRKFAVKLQKQLGKTYEVLWPLARSTGKNTDQAVKLRRKKVRRQLF
jgi:hypothetical protein